MEKDIIQQLHSLRLIEHDSQFKERSRSLILSHKIEKERKFFTLPTWIWAGAFAALLLSFSIYRLFFAPAAISLSSFDAQTLADEFNNLKINIQLEEISYQQSINQAMASAFSEITNGETRHLNPTLLESEKKNLNLEETPNPEIENLLHQILL